MNYSNTPVMDADITLNVTKLYYHKITDFHYNLIADVDLDDDGSLRFIIHTWPSQLKKAGFQLNEIKSVTYNNQIFTCKQALRFGRPVSVLILTEPTKKFSVPLFVPAKSIKPKSNIAVVSESESYDSYDWHFALIHEHYCEFKHNREYYDIEACWVESNKLMINMNAANLNQNHIDLENDFDPTIRITEGPDEGRLFRIVSTEASKLKKRYRILTVEEIKEVN